MLENIKKRASSKKMNKLDYLEAKMMEISNILTPYVIEFCRLDMEFKNNLKNYYNLLNIFIINGKYLIL